MTPLSLLNGGPSDALNDSPLQGETFDVYQGYKFAETMSATPIVTSWSTSTTWTVYISGSAAPSTPSASILTFSFNPMQTNIFYPDGSSSSTRGQQCRSKLGYYNSFDQSCTTYWVASQLCFKVSQASPSIPAYWSSDFAYGGQGCQPYTPLPSSFATPPRFTWSPVIWSQVDGTFGGPAQSSITPQLTVRSVMDPWVQAEYITGGDLNFGLSRGQQAKLGFFLVIVGSVLMLPCFITCYCLRNRGNRSKYLGRHISYFRSDAPSSSGPAVNVYQSNNTFNNSNSYQPLPTSSSNAMYYPVPQQAPQPQPQYYAAAVPPPTQQQHASAPPPPVYHQQPAYNPSYAQQPQPQPYYVPQPQLQQQPAHPGYYQQPQPQQIPPPMSYAYVAPPPGQQQPNYSYHQ